MWILAEEEDEAGDGSCTARTAVVMRGRQASWPSQYSEEFVVVGDLA